MKVVFCLSCGARLDRRLLDGREREVCPQCGFIHYRQLIVGAGALVEQRGTLLLIRRATSPFQNCWGLPAGHVEADENPAAAAVRETLEETGLRVSVRRLVNAYFFDDHSEGNGVFLVYACDVTGGDPAATAEASRVAFFERESLPEELAGGGHRAAIIAWKETIVASNDPLQRSGARDARPGR